MPVVGAVLRLVPDPTQRADALARLRQDPRVTLGALAAPHLPVVVDTPNQAEDDAFWADLEGVPGVLGWVVAYADISDAHDIGREA